MRISEPPLDRVELLMANRDSRHLLCQDAEILNQSLVYLPI